MKIFFVSTLLVVAAGLALVEGGLIADLLNFKFDADYLSFLNTVGNGVPTTWTPTVAASRQTIFQQVRNLILAHNAQPGVTFKLALNEFSDKTPDELRAMTLTNASLAIPSIEPRALPVPINAAALTATPPASLDWRSRFSTVLHQMNCGSCWSFATVSMLEAFYRITLGSFTQSISNQYFVSCDRYDNGCGGGWPTNLLQWIRAQSYLVPNTPSYPYTSGSTRVSGTCKTTGLTKISTRFSNIIWFKPSQTPSTMVTRTKQLLAAYGPLTIAVQVPDTCRNFFSYRSGIYVDGNCCTRNCNAVTHAMVLVGYGKDAATKKEFWILRNSWGTGWGENGYMRYAIDSTNKCSELCHLMGVEK